MQHRKTNFLIYTILFLFEACILHVSVVFQARAMYLYIWRFIDGGPAFSTAANLVSCFPVPRFQSPRV